VRDLAARRNIVLSRLPEQAGVARSHFWDVLRLKKSPTLAWLERVARALDADAAALLAPLDGEAAFLRVEGPEAARDKTALPLVTLADAVAGADASEWVTPKTDLRLRRSMFVARIVDATLAPAVPDGAFAIFDRQLPDLLNGRIVLVQHRHLAGGFAVRRWNSKRAQVTLLCDDGVTAPLVLSAREARSAVVVAELVEVLPS
jgi:hypothetical protein